MVVIIPVDEAASTQHLVVPSEQRLLPLSYRMTPHFRRHGQGAEHIRSPIVEHAVPGTHQVDDHLFFVSVIGVACVLDALFGDRAIILEIGTRKLPVLIGERREAQQQAAARMICVNRGDIGSRRDVLYQRMRLGL